MKRLLYILCASIVGTAFADNENFDGLDKSGADFSGASLKDSSWVGATVSDATFTNADISGATFDSTTGFTANQLYSTKNYATDNTLENLTLSNLGELGYLNLRDKKINSVKVIGNTYTGTNGIIFDNSTIRNSDFSNNTIRNTNANDSTWGLGFGNVDIDGLNLSNSVVESTTTSDYNTPYGIYFANGSAKNVNLKGTTVKVTSSWNFACGIYSETKLSDFDFSNINVDVKSYRDGGVYGARFLNDVENSSFVNATFNVRATNCELSSDLVGAVFRGNVIGCDFSNATFSTSECTDKYGNRYIAVKFGSNLRDCNFTNVNFGGAAFYGDYIVNCDFTNSDLRNSSFYVNFQDCTFTDIKIAGSTIGYCSSNDKSPALDWETFVQTYEYKNDAIERIRFDCNLDAWDLSGKNIKNISFERNLTNSNFENCSFSVSQDVLPRFYAEVAFYSDKDIVNCVFNDSAFLSGKYAIQVKGTVKDSHFDRIKADSTVKFGNIEKSSFVNSEFTSEFYATDIIDSDFSGASFITKNGDGFAYPFYVNKVENSKFIGAKFIAENGIAAQFGASSPKNSYFNNATFSSSRIGYDSYGVLFKDAYPYGEAVASGLHFDGATFTATAENANAYAAYFSCNVSDLTFDGATFHAVADGYDGKKGYVGYYPYRAYGLYFAGNVSNCDFSNVTISGESKVGGDNGFYKFHFEGDVLNSSFKNSDISHSYFGGNMTNVDLTNAVIANCIFGENSHLDKNAFYSTKDYQSGILDGITIKSDIDNWNFSGKTFISSWNYKAYYDNRKSFAKVSNSNFSNATFYTKSDLYDGTALAVAMTFTGDVSNTSFENASFTAETNGSFSKAIGVEFKQSVNNCNFRGAQFNASSDFYTTGAIFYETVSGCDFRDAIFSVYEGNKSFILGGAPEVCGAYFYKDVTYCDFRGIKFNISYSEEGYPAPKYIYGAYFAGDVINCVFDGMDFSDKIHFAGSVINTSFVNTSLAGAKLDNCSFKNTDLSQSNLSQTSLSGANFTFVSLQNADLSKANLEGANLTKVDLRGADLTDVSGEYTLKNTIMADGVIRNFSMTSAEDSAVIVKHTNKTASLSRTARGFSTYNGIGAKISEADAVISGGAKLTIDDGALLEVVDGKSLSVDDGGALEFNIGVDYTGAMLSLESGTSFVLDGGEIIINLSNLFVESGVYTFELIDALYGSFIGCDSLIKDGNIKLFVDGQAYSGEWNFVADASGLSVSVPEPSTYAAVFGALALAFVIYRKRR